MENISKEQQEFLEKMKKLFRDYKDPEKRKTVIEDHFQLVKTGSLYATIIKDVMQEKNLEKWDKDIGEAIEEIDSLIKQTDGPVAGYEKLKNELWFLKYLISEIQ